MPIASLGLEIRIAFLLAILYIFYQAINASAFFFSGIYDITNTSLNFSDVINFFKK